MIPFKEITPEVFVADSPIVTIGENEIVFLKKKAVANERKRARICAHRDNQDLLHEMVVAIAKSGYIRPHKHRGKSESFHIIEGEVDVAVFDDSGQVTNVIELGVLGSGKSPFYRLSESLFHTVVVRSDILVMHEVTNGPFVKDQTVLALFAPDEAETEKAGAYSKELDGLIARFKEESTR